MNVVVYNILLLYCVDSYDYGETFKLIVVTVKVKNMSGLQYNV